MSSHQHPAHELATKKYLCRRAGGQVERCHIVPHQGGYSNAGHSYNVAQIIRSFHPSASLELIGAALDHDVAEYWTGDIPSTAKKQSQLFSEGFIDLENFVEDRLAMMPALDQEERRWLHAADITELFLWAQDQIAMGNRFAEQVVRNLEAYLQRKGPHAVLPEALLVFWVNYEWSWINAMTVPNLARPRVALESEKTA